MSRVVYSKTEAKDMQPNASFFYESKEEAIEDLKEALRKTSPTVVVDRRPIRFNSDDFLVESKVKKVGLRKNEEYRLGKNSRIYLQPYKEGERSGCLLTVEILTNKYMAGLETMVDARYVAIAKILEDFKTFGRPETPKGDGAGIN